MKLVKIAKNCGYQVANYHNWDRVRNPIIFRHDIDYDIDKAVQLAEIENENGISSTYFVLVTSDLYNIFSKENSDKLRIIQGLGHEIGLHFDEMRYSEIQSEESFISKIQKEAQLLEDVIEKPVTTVSMHRPSKKILDTDLKIPNIINCYNKVFFSDFKYLSDSRRRWREPILDIIESKKYDKLHILTHAFWYGRSEESINKTIKKFVMRANYDRYNILHENITDLESIMNVNEIGKNN